MQLTNITERVSTATKQYHCVHGLKEYQFDHIFRSVPIRISAVTPSKNFVVLFIHSKQIST